MNERERRIAENETLFRDLNEQVGVVAQSFSAAGEERVFDFLCECGDVTCAMPVGLTLGRYEDLRRSPVHFFVVLGHEIQDVEVVVESHEAYLVIEKTGEAAEIVRERDPRKKD